MVGTVQVELIHNVELGDMMNAKNCAFDVR